MAMGILAKHGLACCGPLAAAGGPGVRGTAALPQYPMVLHRGGLPGGR
jgi:hypothetical protein